MSDEPYKPDPVGGLVRDALMRFPNDRERAVDYIMRRGPATPQAAAELIDEALRK